MEEEKKKDNQLFISAKQRSFLSHYGNSALKLFMKHETIELKGSGNAVSTAAEVSEFLVHTSKICSQQGICTSFVKGKPSITITMKRNEGLDFSALIGGEDTETLEETMINATMSEVAA
mmetsp:Transcript_622/g.821  ORF Transcript_622/g.821 Transcript_622/m.821 type:complete len:119 (+) Transcript_622:23-379(+)|eukprot:CAMPEP_0175095100 /NCGR_PEP_ID=MMETSP0086_2-20121207/3962_1 /TAXON_ID=136419 /ORGANISM="Unknown Unknown, Strain D1" /LENGTH=118 /DNA_ID=CAMNT_0016368299 /DNA_START=23 /DNA_END=379 /DNA_ORIENTATION=-